MKTDRPRIWLSVDWDYFCRQPKAMWNGGQDESASKTTVSWSIRAAFCLSRGMYLKEEMSLRHARPVPGRFWRALSALGYGFDGLKDIVVADSHKYAYRAFRGQDARNVRLVSFDAHHDLFYTSKHMIEHLTTEKADCGNWHMLTLMRYSKLRSLLVYPHWKGLVEWRRMMKNLQTVEGGESSLGIKKWIQSRVKPCVWPSPHVRAAAGQVERIFICRSSAWTPPWHDEAFYRFVFKGEDHVGLLSDEREMPPNRDFNWDDVLKSALLEQRLLGLKKRLPFKLV